MDQLRCQYEIDGEEKEEARTAAAHEVEVAKAEFLIAEAALLKGEATQQCEDALVLVRLAEQVLDRNDDQQARLTALEVRWQCLGIQGKEEESAAVWEEWSTKRAQLKAERCSAASTARASLRTTSWSVDTLRRDAFAKSAWLLSLASSRREFEDEAGALVLARRALVHADQTHNQELRADALSEIGWNELILGRIEDAIAHIEEARAILTRIYCAEADEVREVYWLLGQCQSRLGNHRAALGWFERYLAGTGPSDGGYCETIDVSVVGLCAGGYAPACARCEGLARGCGDSVQCRGD